MSKLVIIIAFLILVFSAISIRAQEINFEMEYDTLLVEYEELLDDYEDVINELDALNSIYEKEIDMHELSKKQIIIDQIEIEMLRDDIKDLLYLVDPKYITLYLIAGYQGVKPLGGIALSFDIPKIPFAIYAGAEYIISTGVNMKLGVGVKF